jgi:hypothetical protein
LAISFSVLIITFFLQASCIVYGVMLHRIITSQKVQQEDTLGKVKATARASIIIMPVLGFTWMFAILDFFFDRLAFKYLFAIFNSLQGLFIFIFHCVLSKQVHTNCLLHAYTLLVLTVLPFSIAATPSLDFFIMER